MRGELGGLSLRRRQVQVNGRVESLTDRQGILTVELSQGWRPANHFLILVGTGEVVQSEEIHLFGSPDITAGQPCVSTEDKEMQRE